MQLVLEVPEKKRVYQHNNLVNAKYDMSLYQMRIFLFLLTKINAYDKEFAEVRIPVSIICDSQGGNSQSILDDITSDLGRWAFTFNTLQTNQRGKVKEGKVTYPLLSKCSYVKGNSYVEAKFNGDFTEFLLALKDQGNFTESDYKELRGLKNFCSHRIYWLLKEKYIYGYRDIEVAALRDMMNLDGKYPKFNDFKTKVIDQVQKELATTAVAFEYKLLTQGRSVVGIRFQLLKEAKLGAPKSVKTSPTTKQADLGFTDVAYTKDEQKAFDWMLKMKLARKYAHLVMKKAPDLQAIHSACYEAQIHKMNNPQDNLALHSYNAFKKTFQF